MTIAENFPTRYEPKAIEKKWQDEWYRSKIYRFEEDSKRPIFSIDTPPPTVSGNLHIGHVFSYTQAEIISRYHRMRGKNVYYPFGYDDNGLPTELLTEKDHGIRAYQTDRQKFRELCLETGKKYSVAFSDLWKSLGFSCDFDSAYSTISPMSRKISQWSFIDLHRKGKLERRREPALWCVKCVTSFAQAEIEDQNKAGQYVHIPFVFEGAANEALIIATTRPELLAACVAVFVHPDDPRYKNFIGKKVKVPFYNHAVPVLADPKAQMDKGTGAVMCCTFGDTTDIAWWREHKLPLREAISKIGKMTEITGPLQGAKIDEAQKKITEILKEQNLVLKTVPIAAETRVVNTHERCGTPVEFLVQPQWFIKVVEAKERLIELGRKIKWHPDFMRHRYENWVENLSWDWAISRQRSFGVPIPAWYSEDGKHIHIADESELPMDPTLTKPKVKCPSGEWIGDPDVLDTWATSSVTPLINARWHEPNERKNFLPMTMRPQAHDIIRTWAFYTIVKSYYHFGDIPWVNTMIAGHVKKPNAAPIQGSQMAGQEFVKKTKISKSKDGDTFSPTKIRDRHSADSIRLWSAAASLGTDVLFDETGISDAEKFLNKLWNATRFALLNLEGFRPQSGAKPNYPVDRWIFARLAQITNHFTTELERYELHAAKVELDKFFWIDFCDNYIEFIKWRCLSSDVALATGAKQSLYEVLLQVISLYAPFAPHITEEIYQLYFKQFVGSPSLHLTELRTFDSSVINDEALQIGKLLVGSIGLVRSYKSKNQLAFKTPMQNLQIWASANQIVLLDHVREDIRQFAQAEAISIGTASEKDLSTAYEQDFDGVRITPTIDPKVLEEIRQRKAASQK